jgi:GcrA cell cycle regulator
VAEEEGGMSRRKPKYANAGERALAASIARRAKYEAEMTPERRALIGEVARLWEEGVVASEIGRRLGVTKNTVIGIKTRHPDLEPRWVAPVVPKKPPVVFPSGGCLYGHGNVGDEDFHFCGEPVAHAGEAWCATHRAVVYTRAP